MLLSSPSFPSLYIETELPHSRCSIWHLFSLNYIWWMTGISNSLKSLCRVSLSLRELTAPPNSVLLTNLVHIPLSPKFRLLMKTMKCAELRMDTSGTPLVTRCWPDVIPFTISLCAQPMNQLLTHHVTWLSSCELDILSRRILRETLSESLLKSERITSVDFPRPARWDTLSQEESRFDTQDFPIMKPCWL